MPLLELSDAFIDDPEDVLYGVEPLRILVSPLGAATPPTGPRATSDDRLAGRLGVTVRLADRMLDRTRRGQYAASVFLSMAVDLGRRWLKRGKRRPFDLGREVIPTPPMWKRAASPAWPGACDSAEQSDTAASPRRHLLGPGAFGNSRLLQRRHRRPGVRHGISGG